MLPGKVSFVPFLYPTTFPDERFSLYNDIIDYHYNILRELFPSDNHSVYNFFKELALCIEEKLHRVPGDNYNFEYDQLVSYGELISTRIVSAFLETSGLKNKWTDARYWLITDDTFREGKVDFYQTELKIRDILTSSGHNIFVTQGFIGGTADGYTTTLGREGSDVIKKHSAGRKILVEQRSRSTAMMVVS